MASSLKINEDYFIFPQSGDGSSQGMPVHVGFGIQAPTLRMTTIQRFDVKGKVVIIDRGTPDADDPHGKFGEYAAIDLEGRNGDQNGSILESFSWIRPIKHLRPLSINYSRKYS
jgi:hypothetical protein